ncbi:MAG: citrate transporter [Oscillibacter sp.]|jgi:Na+/H+ antiporter NhaD/arsenite permease-like protein|nr:citrate transporter [Oscillibacter sp.]
MLRQFFRREPVLCIAALCALASMFAVPLDALYVGYVDLRVLGLLWSLMAVVAGFRRCGVFEALTRILLTGHRGGRCGLSVALVLLPFFTSMAVTNDVALLTFVPFTLSLLEAAGCMDSAIPLVVLQTIAANLGSMATPVGNPQNLYLYAYYQLSAGAFFSALVPLTAISLVCLTAAALPVLPKNMPVPNLPEGRPMDKKRLCLYAVLFMLCLLCVFHVLPWWCAAAVILCALALTDRDLLKQPDYMLLLTFVCFFVFSGNLGRIEPVRELLRAALDRSTLLCSVLASQIISNVPAAVLLSGFTSDWRGLLLGTDIGGLGTPVASLASLISLKLYLRTKDAKPGRYLLLFTLCNLAGLIILLAAAKILQ